MTRTLNFSSGPAMLPEPVLRRAQSAIMDLDGSGIGILEHSHRGPEFGRVLERTERLVREVGKLTDDHAVLFVTAGATHHFAMVPQNFLSPGQTADYCHSGVWSAKAMEEAKRVGGSVHVASSSEPKFTSTPTDVSWSSAPVYCHYTSNETIYGTQWREPPAKPPAPLVCDASSDIFSRPLPLDHHGMIYAGAQKNLGPSGISLVIARRDFIAKGRADLSPLAKYSTYAKEQSMHNTPNTFGVYIIGEVLQWILDEGGLVELETRNRRKAAVLYDFLDQSKVWKGHADAASRSTMNITFRGATKELEAKLLARAAESGMSGLAGHRSVGGMRASIYNAFPESGVTALVRLLDEVERSS